jgi:hypothetical protein
MTTPDLGNTPDMLRKLAADIEAGKYGAVYTAGVVLEAAGCPVLSFGPNGESIQNVSELFSMAHTKLARDRLEYMESLTP